ncbi:UNVERIFIED_CONTAM: Cyclin-U4-1 [Sesamum latifolium]|uniref:Cyclin n=1 Tax=Sesamum latifolium TaxID=2727402 RepID=A0AAW2T810_9LAMI
MAELESPEAMLKVVKFLSSLLQRVAEANDVFRCFDTQKVSIFHGLTRPTISIQCYLERIFKYANCSPSCFIVAYVYLDRFSQRQPLLPINSFNVHRLLIASVLVSAKFMDDIQSPPNIRCHCVFSGIAIATGTVETVRACLIWKEILTEIGFYNNAYYAKVGGISTAEMNLLEVDFLFGLGFELNVSTATFHRYCSYLQREMLLEFPPLTAAPSPQGLGRTEKLRFCVNDEGSTHHQQQQLAV